MLPFGRRCTAGGAAPTGRACTGDVVNGASDPPSHGKQHTDEPGQERNDTLWLSRGGLAENGERNPEERHGDTTARSRAHRGCRTIQ